MQELRLSQFLSDKYNRREAGKSALVDIRLPPLLSRCELWERHLQEIEESNSVRTGAPSPRKNLATSSSLGSVSRVPPDSASGCASFKKKGDYFASRRTRTGLAVIDLLHNVAEFHAQAARPENSSSKSRPRQECFSNKSMGSRFEPHGPSKLPNFVPRAAISPNGQATCHPRSLSPPYAIAAPVPASSLGAVSQFHARFQCTR